MRTWMINPKLMCMRHICGEHNEIHSHRHIFVKHHSIAGRVKPGDVQIEPMSMKKRHDKLAKYLKNHKTPYRMPDLSYLPKEHREAKVDRRRSYLELVRRCPKCREKMV